MRCLSCLGPFSFGQQERPWLSNHDCLLRCTGMCFIYCSLLSHDKTQGKKAKWITALFWNSSNQNDRIMHILYEGRFYSANHFKKSRVQHIFNIFNRGTNAVLITTPWEVTKLGWYIKLSRYTFLFLLNRLQSPKLQVLFQIGPQVSLCNSQGDSPSSKESQTFLLSKKLLRCVITLFMAPKSISNVFN